jgi:hypothetical protein
MPQVKRPAVAEQLAILKTARGVSFLVGSNPTPSAQEGYLGI